DKDGIISVTAYDQLRYLNNKDTYVYENKTASQLVKMIADDFSLNLGTVENSGFVIASRVEENTSLFDMIENALDLTLQNNKEMFVLYDDFGKLTLKNISSMYVGKNDSYLLIDEETGENFEYTSSIDSDTYNKIKLTFDNEDTGKREVYIAKDTSHINKWGVLQYFDTLSEGENGQAKADALLKLYNAKTRNLRITNAVGDVRVRAGSMVAVKLDLGDVKVSNFMLVEKVKHTFKLDEHFMDLTLRGGEFVG
ncbi:MAG: hydrolase, partial [Ruminiclostridium sp.]|nr:hydrolase [Ruminiclostridium sp.]